MTDEFGFDALIDRLSTWRRVPGYRLEPRVDALVAPYLPTLIAGLGEATDWQIFPEFRIPRSIAFDDGGRSKNQSVAVDFLLIGPKHEWQFVELKTARSRRPSQDEYLRKLADTTASKLMQGLTTLRDTCARKDRPRYEELLSQLGQLLPGDHKAKPTIWYVAPESLQRWHATSPICFRSLSQLADVVAPLNQSLATLLRVCNEA